MKLILMICLFPLALVAEENPLNFECRTFLDFQKIANHRVPDNTLIARFTIAPDGSAAFTEFKVWQRESEESDFLREINRTVSVLLEPGLLRFRSVGQSKFTFLVGGGPLKKNPWNRPGEWYGGLMDMGIFPLGETDFEKINLFEVDVWCFRKDE